MSRLPFRSSFYMLICRLFWQSHSDSRHTVQRMAEFEWLFDPGLMDRAARIGYKHSAPVPVPPSMC
jgi:hypothetical protein